MPEKIDATSYSFPGFFVLAAITRAKALGAKINSNPVEVTFLVNGVELPFVETMNDIHRRMNIQIDAQVRDLAERMVLEAGLDGINDALSEIEVKVKEAINKVLPKQ